MADNMRVYRESLLGTQSQVARQRLMGELGTIGARRELAGAEAAARGMASGAGAGREARDRRAHRARARQCTA